MLSKYLDTPSVSKRSQIDSQIFIYVIAIILFSFILLYGYNAIKGFRDKGEQISYIKFKTDLISTVKRVSPDYGTLKREEFFIGGEYKEVCFVQSYNPPNNLATKISNPIVRNSVESNVTKNVFLFTNTLQPPFYVGEINVSGGYNCTKIINGKVKIQFEGKGDHTLISDWG